MADGRETLATLVRAQADQAEVWERAELHLLEQAFRERLAVLGLAASPDVAVGLMAVATFLAEATPEWGGDSRAVLAEVALLGLRLLEDGAAPTA